MKQYCIKQSPTLMGSCDGCAYNHLRKSESCEIRRAVFKCIDNGLIFKIKNKENNAERKQKEKKKNEKTSINSNNR